MKQPHRKQKKPNRSVRPRRETLVAFVEWGARHRLWIVASMLAAACIQFAYTTFRAEPRRIGALGHSDITESMASADWRRFSTIIEDVDAAVQVNAAALQTFRQDFANRPAPTRPVAPDITEPALALIDSARARSAAARGYIVGTKFFDPALEARRIPVAEDLAMLDRMLGPIREFYIAAGSGDRTAMWRANETLRRMDQDAGGDWAAAYARLEALTEAGLISGQASVARMNESAAQFKWFARERLLALGALVYAAAFLVAAGATWLARRSRGARSVSAQAAGARA